MHLFLLEQASHRTAEVVDDGSQVMWCHTGVIRYLPTYSAEQMLIDINPHNTSMRQG